jgi:rubredoxin
LGQRECKICGYPKAEFGHQAEHNQGGHFVNFDTDTNTTYHCPVCGIYKVHSSMDYNSLYKSNYNIETPTNGNGQFAADEFERNKALLRKSVYETASKDTSGVPLKITAKFAREIFSGSFPTPIDQIHFLVRFLGDNLKYSGDKFEYKDEINSLRILSASSCVNDANLTDIIVNAAELNYVKIIDDASLTLTIHGWSKYHEFKKGISNSKKIFMAMKFDEKQIAFINSNLKPVITNLDYDLSTLPEYIDKENNIDIKLRNSIRDSILLICDLTHRNNGAYFEAGFAEGLGKPVIYICEKSSFDKTTEKIHFDIAHMEIYQWTEG